MESKKTSRKKTNSSLDLDIMGKLPPQEIELEKAILGALMVEKKAIYEVINKLEPEDFYRDSNQLIYRAIVDIHTRHEPIDILTVTNHLRTLGFLEICGGPYYISQLTNRIASAANIEFHSRIIRQKRIQRDLIQMSSEISRAAFDETSNCFDIIDQTEISLNKIIEKGYTDEGVVDSEEAIIGLSKMIDRNAMKTGLIGVTTGYISFNYLTGGLIPPNYYIIAARPSMGKTAFLISSIIKMAFVEKRKGILFSLEMSKEQIMARIISQLSGLNLARMLTGKLSSDEIDTYIKAAKIVKSRLLFIDDSVNSITEIVSKTKMYKKKHNIEWFAIDYIGLIKTTGTHANRDREMSYISNSIKQLCKSAELPGLVLAQLSRDVEKRNNIKNSHKRPILSDLRDSGSLEQDADLIGFLYRAEYYGIEKNQDGLSYEGVCELIIRKNRNGPLDTIRLKFIKEQAKMEDDQEDSATIAAMRYYGIYNDNNNPF